MPRKNRNKKKSKKHETKNWWLEPHTKFDRIDFLLLLGVVLISLFLRIYNLSRPTRMYFDETHYVPAARSYLDPHEIDPNYIHPPLAKEIMAGFISLYGDYSVGWRVGSVVFGILMVIVMYFIGLSMFKNRLGGVLSSLLLGIEFLHIVQSRIATLDIYIAAFILFGYYAAWLYCEKKSIIYLALSAIFFGMATSVKISGIGGAFGAFLYITLISKIEKKRWKFEFVKVSVVFCIIMTVVFVATHIPYLAKGGDPSNMLYIRTLKFHYEDKFEHPYLSQIWEWPTVYRPIWYFWEKDEHTKIIRGIVAIGCLLFWWSFVVMLLLDIIPRAWKNKDKKAIFVSLGYIPLYLFWLSSASHYGGYWHLKGGFFYYMLPCVPFMVIGITDILIDLMDTKLGRISVYVYLLGLILFLIAFYPILTAIPIPQKYYDTIMRLDIFHSWI